MQHGVSPAWATLVVGSVLLAATDIAAVVIAFGLYTLLRPANQVLFQAPVAAVLVCTSCALAQKVLEYLNPRWTPSWTRLTRLGLQLGALICGTVLLVPLHFITQGYLTPVGNIAGLWLFQLPTNALALFLAALLARPTTPAGSGIAGPFEGPRTGSPWRP